MGCSCQNENQIVKNDDIQREAIIEGKAKYISFDALSIIYKQKKNNVFKIVKKNKKIIGTGFFCLIPYPNKENVIPVLITCNHVLRRDDIKIGNEINLIFNDQVEKVLKLNQIRAIYTNDEKEYDISIIEIKKTDGFDLNNMLEIDYDIFQKEELGNFYKNKSIYIIHYPKGKESSYSDSVIKNIDTDNIRIQHLCSTEEGSSGAPILNLDNFKVIGIHLGRHKNGATNIGTLLKRPIEEFNKLNKPSNNKSILVNQKDEMKEEEKTKENKIVLKVEVSEEEINKDIYFLYELELNKKPRYYKIEKNENESNNNDNSSDEADMKIIFPRKNINNLKELDESNVRLFVNNKLTKFRKYFIPAKKGVHTITLKLNVKMIDCSDMFSYCDNIIKIDLSSFDTSQVKNMEFMFSWCTRLQYINFSHLDTSKVENMEGMFNSCFELKNLDLSYFNTSNVTKMSNMFSGCKNLLSLDLSSFDTKKVKIMASMFEDCKNLELLDLSSFEINEELNLFKMINSCPKLKQIYAKKEFGIKIRENI